jgi:two-component system cell cycle sensor histidine kinase/response regulator CckA
LGRLGLWEYDREYRTFWWSDALFRLYGLQPRRESAGLAALESIVPSAQWTKLREWYASIERCDSSIEAFQHDILLKDGTKRVIRTVAAADRNQERSGRVSGIALDVTEQVEIERSWRESQLAAREAVRMLETVLDAIPVRVFWKDLDSKYLGCNTTFAKDAGLERPAQLIGRNDFELGWREQAELYRNDDRAVMKSGTSKLRYEEPQTTPEGDTIWLRTSKIPLCDAQGNIMGVLGTYEDITEYKRFLEQSQHREKLEAIGRLAGGVAHEFNNLLTIMIFNLEFVRRTISEEGAEGMAISGIREAAHRAANLTRQLLAFARRQVVASKVIDINRAIRTVQSLLSPLLGESIEVAVTTTEMPWPVLIDPGQLEQLLINLAVNARDAMPQGGKLEFRTENAFLDESYRREHPDVACGDYVRLVVRDTGTGIAGDAQKHVFEPFYTTKPLGHGTGLGLATCHGIVRQSGGHIELRSEPGRGTVFEIYFPRANISLPATPAAQPQMLDDFRGSETVLLIEDEHDLRELCGRALSGLGYRVLSADTAVQALDLAMRNPGPLDALITDVVLPDMRGPEIGRRLADAFPRLRILYVSGYTEDAIAHHGVFEPGVNFLQKPYTPARLAELLRKALDQR